MKTIVIPIETKSREFVGKLWLASNLVAEDIDVILGDRRIIEKTVLNIDPEFYLAMGTTPQKRNIIEQLSSNTIIGVLDSEGAPTQEDIVDMHDPECMENVQIYFSWGKEQAQKVKSRFGGDNLDIVVSGTPEFDLLHDNLNDIYSLSEHTRNIHDYILIITSLPTVNHYKSKKRKKRRDADPQTYEWEKLMIRNIEQLVKDYLENRDQTVIVRPHPVEDTNTYREMFSDYESVNVKYDGSVRYYIYDASAVIHTGSTAGIESSIMGTPTIDFNTENWYQSSKLPMEVSYETNSIPETIEILDEIANNEETKIPKNLINTSRITKRIHNYNRPLSAKIISENIKKIVSSGDNINMDINEKHSHTISDRLERGLYKHPISDIIKNNSSYVSYFDKILPGHNPTISGQRFQMFPGIAESEINEVLNKLNLGKEISIERIGEYSDMFKLQI